MTIPHPFKFCVAAVLSLLAGLNTQAAVIGINPPVPPLTLERLAEAKPEARQEWTNYLQRSAVQRERDRATLAAERVGLATIPPVPEGGNSEKSMPLDQPAAWYASTAALAVADNMLSFQTPAGGWGKNQPRDRPARLLGQDYVANNASKFATADDFEKGKGHDPQWNYVGTIDNDATITEIRFLARVAAQVPPALADTYRKSAIRGLRYVLDAQFPNGGWPQVWPLQGGYHDATTLNDNAMVQVATLMGAAARGEDDFGFLPPALRDQAAASERRAIDALLQLQITVGGRKMLWAQQYEALTGAPASARNYEPGALCASESAQVLNYLMSLPNPRPEVIAAVHSGAAALRALALEGVVWTKVDELQGRRLVARPGAAPLWARYYSADTLKPVFGNRDKTLHDDINDITLERRNGYAWFVTTPGKTLETYEGWARRWGGPGQSAAVALDG